MVRWSGRDGGKMVTEVRDGGGGSGVRSVGGGGGSGRARHLQRVDLVPRRVLEECGHRGADVLAGEEAERAHRLGARRVERSENLLLEHGRHERRRLGRPRARQREDLREELRPLLAHPAERRRRFRCTSSSPARRRRRGRARCRSRRRARAAPDCGRLGGRREGARRRRREGRRRGRARSRAPGYAPCISSGSMLHHISIVDVAARPAPTRARGGSAPARRWRRRRRRARPARGHDAALAIAARQQVDVAAGTRRAARRRSGSTRAPW